MKNIRNYDNIFNAYKAKGYVFIDNFLHPSKISYLISEINAAENTIRYDDRQNILRRVEKFYNKGTHLSSLNDKISKLLSDIFSKEYVIFKDKYNTKPPGGEGFYPHYDGIFHWISENGNKKNGWYEYAPDFINVLIAFDDSNDLNGTIELSEINNFSFEELISRTKNNGTPEISESIANKLYFEKINLKIGDAVIFSHKCPHRSGINRAKRPRRIIYYTYNELRYGNNYNNYFDDKNTSNPGLKINKALSK